jgi:hypothetical protein
MLGNGVGTKGAGGPGILHTFGVVADDMSTLPSVTGVFGGLTPTLTSPLAQTSPSFNNTADRYPLSEPAHSIGNAP